MARLWLTALLKRGTSIRRRRQWPRQRQRIERYFECNWMSDWGEQQTRISSISPTGCYVVSRLTVPPEGTHVREICVAIPDGEISLHGTVLKAEPGIGFALRFADMDDDSRSRLCGLVGARC